MSFVTLIFLSFTLPAFSGDSFEAGRNPLFLSENDVTRDLTAFCSGSTPPPKNSNVFSAKALQRIISSEEWDLVSLRCMDKLIAELTSLDQNRLRPANVRYLRSLTESRARKKAYLETRIIPENLTQSTYQTQTFEKGFESPRGCAPWILRSFPREINQNMDRIQNLDRSCRSRLLQDLAFEYVYFKNELARYSEPCRENPVDRCERHAQLAEIYRANIRELSRSVGESYEMSEEEIACLPLLDEGLRPENLASMINEAAKALSCAPIHPGESRVVDSGDVDPTGTGAHYLLTREPDGNYVANLRMHFITNDGADLSAMKNKIRECYANANPYIRGPDGERLRLNLMTEEELKNLSPHYMPPVNEVSVTTQSSRAHSRFYPVDASCSTIIHEALHLLGLVDEYDGTADGYTCRVTPKASSIMAQSHEHYSNSLDQVKICECTEKFRCQEVYRSGNKALVDFFQRPFESFPNPEEFHNQCEIEYEKKLTLTFDEIRARVSGFPYLEQTDNSITFLGIYYPDEQGTYTILPKKCQCKEGASCEDQKTRMRAGMTAIYNSSKVTNCHGESRTVPQEITASPEINHTLTDTEVIFYKRKKEASLLAPLQFKRIITGNCLTSTPSYDECAKWTQKAKDADGNCPGRPEACSSDLHFLGIPQ